MDLEKRAGPSPVAVFKRDAAETQSASWADYYASLADCGYDCIQTACSCVASPKVERVSDSENRLAGYTSNSAQRTPAPTCTMTITKETVVAQTKTIEM